MLGNWYAQQENKEILEFQFYKDSLIIYDILGKYTQKWKINDQTLFISSINGPTSKLNLAFKYQLDHSKQLLQLKIAGNDTVEIPLLRKAESVFDFFQISKDVKIELPKTQSDLIPISEPKNLNFNIYAGYKNGELVVKTDSATNLDSLEIEVSKFRENSRKEIRNHLRFNLIADKNIPQCQIDSIKDRLKKTAIDRIFRTYKKHQADYNKSLHWYAKVE